MGRIALRALAAGVVTACAAGRPAPPAHERHRCAVIPTGMVECTPIQAMR